VLQSHVDDPSPCLLEGAERLVKAGEGLLVDTARDEVAGDSDPEAGDAAVERRREVGSRGGGAGGSCPKRTEDTSATSSTVLARGPTWSREEAKATSPYRLTLP
jgi:hypothetical protein